MTTKLTPQKVRKDIEQFIAECEEQGVDPTGTNLRLTHKDTYNAIIRGDYDSGIDVLPGLKARPSGDSSASLRSWDSR